MACVAARSINLNHESRRTTPLPAVVRPAAVATGGHGRACAHRPARRAGAGGAGAGYRPVRAAGQPGHGLDRHRPGRQQRAVVRGTGRGAGTAGARPAELRPGHAAVDPWLRRALDLRCARGADADRRGARDHARWPGPAVACQPAGCRTHRGAARAVLGAVRQLLRRRAAGVERAGPGRRPVAVASQLRCRQHAQRRHAAEGSQPRAGLQHRRQSLPHRWLARTQPRAPRIAHCAHWRRSGRWATGAAAQRAGCAGRTGSTGPDPRAGRCGSTPGYCGGAPVQHPQIGAPAAGWVALDPRNRHSTLAADGLCRAA